MTRLALCVMLAVGCAAEGVRVGRDAGKPSSGALRGPGWAQDDADAGQVSDTATAPERAPDAQAVRLDAVPVALVDARETSRDAGTSDALTSDVGAADARPSSDGPPAPLPDGDGYNRSADCDPWANTGCPDGYKCAAVWGQGGGHKLACLGYGAARVTEECKITPTSDTCATGLACGISGGGKLKCFEFCPVASSGQPCPTSGQYMTCDAYTSNGQTIAFCSQP